MQKNEFAGSRCSGRVGSSSLVIWKAELKLFAINETRAPKSPKTRVPFVARGSRRAEPPWGRVRSLLRAAAPRARRRSRGGEAPPRTTFVIYLIRKLNYLKARKTRKTLVFTSLSRRRGNRDFANPGQLVKFWTKSAPPLSSIH